jgi:hypothetical protein
MMQWVVQNNWILDQRRAHYINRFNWRLLIHTLIWSSTYRRNWDLLLPIIISSLRSIVLDYIPSSHPELILIFSFRTSLTFVDTFPALSTFWWLLFVLDDIGVASYHTQLPTALSDSYAYASLNGAHILRIRNPLCTDRPCVELMKIFSRDEGTSLSLCFADHAIIKTYCALMVVQIWWGLIIVLF